MSKAVEAIVSSFRTQYNQEVVSGEVDDFWFTEQAERDSISLPEVSVDDAETLYHKYGIITIKSSFNNCSYKIEDLDKFVSAVA